MAAIRSTLHATPSHPRTCSNQRPRTSRSNAPIGVHAVLAKPEDVLEHRPARAVDPRRLVDVIRGNRVENERDQTAPYGDEAEPERDAGFKSAPDEGDDVPRRPPEPHHDERR